MTTFAKWLVACLILCFAAMTQAAPAGGRVVEWGRNLGGGATGVPFPEHYYATSVVSIGNQVLTNAVKVAAGPARGFAITDKGILVGWGWNAFGLAVGSGSGESGKTNGAVVLGGRVLSNVIGVAPGSRFNLALRGDGSVVAWGEGRFGETTPPAGLSNVTAISAGAYQGLALKADGTVTAWGRGNAPPPGLGGVVAIAAGGEYGRNLALTKDGTVTDWPVLSADYDSTVPRGLSNVVAVAAGGGHGLALRQDGTVVGWGANNTGQATGIPTLQFPHQSTGTVSVAGRTLKNVVAIAAGREYSLGLRNDGTVVAWGHPFAMEMEVPGALSNVVAIAAGENFCLAVTTNPASPWSTLQAKPDR